MQTYRVGQRATWAGASRTTFRFTWCGMWRRTSACSVYLSGFQKQLHFPEQVKRQRRVIWQQTMATSQPLKSQKGIDECTSEKWLLITIYEHNSDTA